MGATLPSKYDAHLNDSFPGSAGQKRSVSTQPSRP